MGIQINGTNDTITTNDGTISIDGSTTLTGSLTGTTGTFSGDIGVAGTLTSEDKTNIDSVGLITARTGIKVGPITGVAATHYADGSIRTTGVITATTYYGSGANLTGIDATQIQTGNTSVQTVDTGSDGHVKVLTEGSERFRISNNGDVRVGGGAPATFGSGTTVHETYNANTYVANLVTSGTHQLQMIASQTHGATSIGTRSNHNLNLCANDSTKMTILTGGNVGIGTNNPQCLLDMSKDISSGVNYVDIRNHHASGGAALRIKTQGTYGSPTYQAIVGASDAGGTIRVGAVSNHPLLLLTNNTERLRIDTSGKLLVGATAATGAENWLFRKDTSGGADGARLTVYNGGSDSVNNQAKLTLKTTHSETILSSYNQGEFYISNSHASSYFMMYMGGTQRYRMNNDGSAFWTNGRGAGTNDQCYLMEQVNGNHSWGTVLRLHVNSSGGDRAAICFSSGNGWGNNWLVGQTNATNDYRWNFGGGYGTGLWGSTKMHLYTNGNLSIAGSYSSSDQRLKENIADITNPTTKLKSLRGRTFTWQERAGHASGTQYGFIAQEVQPHVPELVEANGNHYFDKDDNIVYEDNTTRAAEGGGRSLSLNYGQVTPIIVEALKEAIAKIETLESKVAALES